MVADLDPPKAKHPGGRPSSRTPEMAEEIISRIELGESLVSICDDAHTPDYSTVCRWLEADPEFHKRYAHAREIQAQFMEGKGMSIVMNAKPETATVARVQFDAIRWLTAKLHPKVYGDQPQAITINNNVVVVSEAQRSELMQVRAEMQERRSLTTVQASTVQALPEPKPAS